MVDMVGVTGGKCPNFGQNPTETCFSTIGRSWVFFKRYLTFLTEQSRPVNREVQAHVIPVAVIEHIPPFLHVLLAHICC